VFETAPGTVGCDVAARRYGLQDRGIAPGGAGDQRSFRVALALLGEPEPFRCVELLHVVSVTFTADVLFTVTGARHEEVWLGGRPVGADTVCAAGQGETLRFGKKVRGLRTYLTATPAAARERIGLSRGAYERWFDPPAAAIRAFLGPEASRLHDPERFFDTPWRIGTDSDRMGLRLDGPPLEAESYDIASAAVDDGTVQLSASGPIVLMRGRQSTGGYARIFQVARCDLDLLAQTPPGRALRFEPATRDAALRELRKHEAQIEAFRHFCGCGARR